MITITRANFHAREPWVENDWYECPECGNECLDISFNYCPICGEPLMWELED